MDYIYSYLNDDVASREMHGSETNTAVVTVNATTNTISVDVKPISPSMLNVTKPTETGSYILQETISAIGEVSYSWATLEDYNQEVTQAIANLTQQLEQEKQERIESVQAEANTRELADTQLRTEFTSEIAQEKQEREQAVSKEAQRTDSMINQLNNNVQEGFNTINDVLTTSINNINNAILNESTIREEQFDDTTFRIRDLNTRLGVEIDNRESGDAEIYANLSTDIANEKRERVEQDQDIRNSIGAEANAREEAIETLQSNIDAEANERKSVDQHLWDILPDNIIAGTPMQGMENENAINIVFSKYQKHGIGEDPSDAELVEVPNQAITLFPATQEVAGVLTAADKTKIDNIATDIETAVQAETNRATNAENALDEKINTTKNDILGDVAESYNTLGKLEDAIQDEASTRSSADTQLQNSIDAEANARQEADTSLQKSISDEVTRATQAETSINGRIDDVITNASHPLVDSVAVNITSGNTATLNYTTYNPGNGTIGENSSVAIPMATTTSAGLMSSTYVDDINNSVKKNGVAEQTVNGVLNVSGNVTIGGNLHVQGNTVSVDTETLNVVDNLIVTNSDGTELEYPSGIAIKTNGTSAFGIVYAPDVDELKAGIGAVDENNEFSFNPDEGNPVTLRDSDTELTDGNILVWTNAGHKLIDSNIPSIQIARKDQAQTFNGVQTFTNTPIVPSINVNGVQLTSNVAGNIAVESQITEALGSLTNGSSATISEIVACISSVGDDLQEYKQSTNQNITQIEDDLASEGNRINQVESDIDDINANITSMSTSISSAQSCATSAYTQAYTATDIATNANTNVTNHIADKNNPHEVNATQVGLGNVKNIDTTNATNITTGSLAINLIASGLIEKGDNVTVTRADSGVYTVSACVPVTSVANKTGAVTLDTLKFTGACTATYNGASSVTVAIPTVPTLHSVSISTNNGSATTVVGNVYSNSVTPIEIPIPESQTITLANTYNVSSGANGIVTGISLENGVLTVSYGALDDGTL